jgi:hypothetical protein
VGGRVRRTAARALGLLVAEVILFLALSLILAGTTGPPWDVAFVVGLVVVIAPVFLLEELGQRRSAVDAALAVAVGLWAALAFVVVFLQVTYSANLLAHHDIPRALTSSESLIAGVWHMASETRALILAWAPAFGVGFFLARRGVSRWVAVPAILLTSLAVARLGLIGFEGIPQVRWLVFSTWTSPWLGPWVMLQPWLLALSLPLLGWLAERRWPRQGSGVEEDLQHSGLARAGEGGLAVLEGELPVDEGPQGDASVSEGS